MGGLALSAWRYPRSTRDVDLVIAVEGFDPEKLVACLSGAGFCPKHSPAIRSIGAARILQMEFDPPGTFVSIPTDVLLVDSDYHRVAFCRTVQFRLGDAQRELKFLACEDLILHKLLAGQLIDRSDAAALIRANRESLDVDYLLRWSANIGVRAELREVWSEALPDETLPT
jgi:hypothetical protein